MRVTPFEIRVPQPTLDDLRNRLERVRWADEIEDDGWDHGTGGPYLKALVEHWLTRFDWRQQEEALNRFAHFRADVDGFGSSGTRRRRKPLHVLPQHTSWIS